MSLLANCSTALIFSSLASMVVMKASCHLIRFSAAWTDVCRQESSIFMHLQKSTMLAKMKSANEWNSYITHYNLFIFKLIKWVILCIKQIWKITEKAFKEYNEKDILKIFIYNIILTIFYKHGFWNTKYTQSSVW